ncbi:DNA polymerase [uncultured Clostridium sp.]|uniref:DNA polymerase n=1 Tax=uncultured Clostridium sp. TaxID=59620 RepID=UPI0026F3D407|nr:DNA polymerase [uncultured Clostridium sp.]
MIVGIYDNGVTENYVILRQSTYIDTWFVISKYHKDDILKHMKGEVLSHRVLNSIADIEFKNFTKDYIIGSLKFSRVKGTTSYYGNIRQCEEVVNLLNLAKNYAFSKNSNNIKNEEYINEVGEYIKNFDCSDEKLHYSYLKSNQEFQRLSISYGGQKLDLQPSRTNTSLFKLEYKELIKKDLKERLKIANLNDVDLELLANKLDLSWYLDENGNPKLDYRDIVSIYDFENDFISNFIDSYNEIVARGDKVIFSQDTETNGLGIYYLDKSNPNRSTCCAVPMAFNDKTSYVIYTDMEYIDSIPNEYVWSRLKPLVEKDLLNNENNIFEFKVNSQITGYEKSTIIDRNNIILVGHNVMFDGRVAYQNGVKPEWDEDTLQMAFNLNPTIIKGNNGLKNLTRKFFDMETPELTDLLGKGNEDKYRYLTDRRVAKIYGCADADFTRRVYKKLLELTPADMYKSYKEDDIPLLNRLYISEYYGLNMESDKVKTLSEECVIDMDNLKNFLYKYVGLCIYQKEVHNRLDLALQSGQISEAEYISCRKAIDYKKAKPYVFDTKGNEIRKVLYDILEYPILAYTTGEKPLPKVDKKVMDMLIAKKGEPKMKITADLVDSTGTVLVSKEDFNGCKYPLALVLKQLAILTKEYDSYFKPILDNNMEGRLFKSYSTTRIETRRIMNPSQTLKGSLKKLTVPFSDDYYMVDFDMSQVEYRIMIALAGFQQMIDKMSDPEKDFHTETASLVNDILPHKVSKTLRKGTKNVSFGIPYGLGLVSLCINIHGDASPAHLYETRKLYEKFILNNKPVIDMIESYRADAVKEWNISKEFRDYINGYYEDSFGNKQNKKIGRVRNTAGFHRVFDITDVDDDKAKLGVVRRAAGNYPIQSIAGEKFRNILNNFYKRCLKEGIEDKCIWHMLIHDELLLSVHKSVNPFLIFKIVYEECMLPLEEGGAPFYFCGINLGKNWGECKDDASEAPVKFVERMIKRYDAGEFDGITWFDDAKAFVDKYRYQYLVDRIYEVIKEIQPDLDYEPINFNNIKDNMSNYTVRAYITDFFVPNVDKKKFKDASDDVKLALCLENWICARFGEGKEFAIDGVARKAKLRNGSYVDISNILLGNSSEQEEAIKAELIAPSYWSFDDRDNGSTQYEFDLGDDQTFLDTSKNTYSSKTNLNDLFTFKTYQRKYVSHINGIVFVKVPLKDKRNVRKYLNKVLGEGKKLYLGMEQVGTISEDYNLDTLDKEIGGLINNGYATSSKEETYRY